MNRSLLALLGLVLASGIAMAQPKAAKRYAILVGVNAYDHDKLPPLNYAENDVVALDEILRKAGYETALLCDREGKKNALLQPTKANIERTLAVRLHQFQKGDTILIALAGHGLQFDDRPDAFFCPSDAKPFPDRADTLISLGRLYKDLDLAFAGVKVLLVDACRNSMDLNRVLRSGIDGDQAPKPPTGVAALFSCSAGQRAYEYDDLKHGVFFHHVIEGLKGPAKDVHAPKTNDITFGSLASYVSARVEDDVAARMGPGAKQAPNMKADLSGRSPVLVRLKPDDGDGSPPKPPIPARPRQLELTGACQQGTDSYPGTVRLTIDGENVTGELHLQQGITLTLKGKLKGDTLTLRTYNGGVYWSDWNGKLSPTGDRFEGRHVGVNYAVSNVAGTFMFGEP